MVFVIQMYYSGDKRAASRVCRGGGESGEVPRAKAECRMVKSLLMDRTSKPVRGHVAVGGRTNVPYFLHLNLLKKRTLRFPPGESQKQHQLR